MIVFGEPREATTEQAGTFTGLSEFVQALTNHLSNQECQSQEKNMWHARAENIISEYREPWRRLQAKLSQELMEPFDESKVYDSLIDPFSKTRQDNTS